MKDLYSKLKMWESNVIWAAGNILWWLTLTAALEYFGMSSETLIILTVMLILDWLFWIANAYIRHEL